MVACTPDVPVSFLEAWGYWWDGNELKDCDFWLDQRFLFWARFGKVLQYLGGAVAVLDIIGAKRLARILRKIGVWGLIRKIESKVAENLAQSPSRGGGSLAGWLAGAFGMLIGTPAWIAFLACGAVALVFYPLELLYELVTWSELPAGNIFQVIIFILWIAILGLWALWIAGWLLLFICHLAASLISAVVYFRLYLHAAKVAAFLMVSAGFILDLLGS